MKESVLADQIKNSIAYVWELDGGTNQQHSIFGSRVEIARMLRPIYKQKPTQTKLSAKNLICEIRNSSGTVLGKSKVLASSKDGLMTKHHINFSTAIKGKLVNAKASFYATNATHSHIALHTFTYNLELSGTKVESPFREYDDKGKIITTDDSVITWVVESIATGLVVEKGISKLERVASYYSDYMEFAKTFAELDSFHYEEDVASAAYLLTPESKSIKQKTKLTGMSLEHSNEMFNLRSDLVDHYTGKVKFDLTEELTLDCSAQ